MTNQIYSVVISGLLSNTTYYYQAVATNSFSSARSSVNSVVTVSLRKLVAEVTGGAHLTKNNDSALQLFLCLFELKD